MLLLSASAAFAADASLPRSGPVGRWDFDEGKGVVARDSSGNNNHGKIHGATFVKRGKGYALRFDGDGDYVDCGVNSSLALGSAGTLELWFKPEALKGGLLRWGKGTKEKPRGDRWCDQRVLLTYYSYRGRRKQLAFSLADGSHGQHEWLNRREENTWHHIAVTFDGNMVRVYRDGVLDERFAQLAESKHDGAPLWIGRCVGMGPAWFKGLIDEVRVYGRALSAQEILAHYKQEADAMGKDIAVMSRPQLDVAAFPEPGWIVAHVDFGRMLPRPQEVELGLHSADSGKDLDRAKLRAADHPTNDATVRFDMTERPPGKYEIRAEPKGNGSVAEVVASTVDWPGQAQMFKGVKILNNIVWELLNTSPGKLEGRKTYAFTQPKTRCVYVACAAKVGGQGKLRLSITSARNMRDIIVFDPESERDQKTMRFLPAGEHLLVLEAEGQCSVENLVVRSTPELIYVRYESNPFDMWGVFGQHYVVEDYRYYVKEFLKKHVLKNITTFVSDPTRNLKFATDPFLDAWHNRGGRWLIRYTVDHRREWTPETFYGSMAEFPLFDDPRTSGLMVDEFGRSRPDCAPFAGALRKLKASPEFGGKVVNPYANELYDGPEGMELIRTIINTGSKLALKRYVRASPTERLNRIFLKYKILDPVREYRKHCPSAVENMILNMGIMDAHGEFLNVYPNVNYKTQLDMQFNLVANEPVFWATYGLASYSAHWAHEETIRWVMTLFRHYAIQGNTKRASNDPYIATHLANSDFVRGTDGWELRPAEEGSMRADRLAGFSTLSGRFPGVASGDHGLVAVRSVRKPNVFSQEIKDLTPGRLYSFRMITGDFNDLSLKDPGGHYTNGRFQMDPGRGTFQELSEREKHTVSIKLDNVEELPEKAITTLYGNAGGHRAREYRTIHSAWMTYHYRVFRAKARTAKVTISDWAGEKEPAGPIGQALLYNFVTVLPYYEE